MLPGLYCILAGNEQTGSQPSSLTLLGMGSKSTKVSYGVPGGAGGLDLLEFPAYAPFKQLHIAVLLLSVGQQNLLVKICAKDAKYMDIAKEMHTTKSKIKNQMQDIYGEIKEILAYIQTFGTLRVDG